MADVNDSTLIVQFADHQSEAAFAELVQRHVRLVYSVAFRYVGNEPDAQDVVQAVFIILTRKAASLRNRNTLTGWLYDTTRFTARQLLRTKARQRIRDQEAYMQAANNDSNENNLWLQLEPHIEKAISRLRASDRELLALRFFENKTAAEAAGLLGIGVEATHKRTARALVSLQKYFAKLGVNSSSAILAETISANSVQIPPAALIGAVTSIVITKGAAASAPTLNLVKVATKIMAWTKAKTAIVVGVAVFVAVTTGTIVIKTISQPLPKLEKRAFKVDRTFVANASPQVHSKAYFIKVPENSVQAILKTGTVVDSKEKNIVEIMSSSQTISLLRGLRASGSTILSEPEVTTLSSRETQIRSGDTIIDFVATLLGDGYTLKMTIMVSSPENLLANVNIWDNQTIVLAPANSNNGKTRLLVFVTTTLVDAAGNRVHSKNELPINPSAVPPQE